MREFENQKFINDYTQDQYYYNVYITVILMLKAWIVRIIELE